MSSNHKPTEAALKHSCALVRQKAQERAGLLVVGICGAQGSGKSRLAAVITSRLGREGICTDILSIDDLYLTRRQRHDLA